MNKLHIKKLDVLSIAKIQAAVCAALGLIFGVIYFIFIALFGMAMMGIGGRQGAAGGIGMMVGGLFGIVIGVVLYAILGFIIGAISALIYNVVAGIIGGIEIEVETLY